MKYDEIALGEAARGMLEREPSPIGQLSPSELATAATRAWIEQEEDWLYEALKRAQGCRLRMDRAAAWNQEYVLEYRQRELALATASRHYLALMDAGAAISPLIAQLIVAEGGFTP